MRENVPELVEIYGAGTVGVEHSALISFPSMRSPKKHYLIIMRTVCGSKGDQSPFTSAVRNSASVKLPLPILLSLTPLHTQPQKTYHPCLQPQTASTAHLDHSHPAGAQALAGVSVAVRSVVYHGKIEVGVHDRSSQVVETQRWALSRCSVSRSDRCMRPVEVCCRNSQDDRRISLLGGSHVASLERVGEACCSPDALRTFAGAVGLGTSFVRPKCVCVNDVYAYILQGHSCTCSGSACAGNLSGLKPLLYAMMGYESCERRNEGCSGQ